MIGDGKGNNLLPNDVHVRLGREWARGIPKHHLKWVKRASTTDRRLNSQQLRLVAAEAREIELEMLNYHPDLVLTMDETLSPWCPLNRFTYAPVGESTITIQGTDDSRGNTATITCTLSNRFLPLQLIWAVCGQTT
ncbi:hypothetical protein RCL1_003074 [Eukaryota sp. TZLM3-RCL]